MLANALYFRGGWEHRFPERSTKDAPFTQLSGDSVVIPMMNQGGKFGYFEDSAVQVLELRYRGGRHSMIIALPRSPNSLPKLEAGLTYDRMRGWQEKLASREAHVFFPRLEFERQFELSGTLSSMGMPDAFLPDSADFSGMATTTPLWIGLVVQKERIAVDEEGTEAAAATAVENAMSEMTPDKPPEPPVVFRADHPFLFWISDRATGIVMFLGRVVDPSTAR